MKLLLICLILPSIYALPMGLRHGPISDDEFQKQEAAFQETYSVCDVCKTVYIEMRKNVAKDDSLFHFGKEQEFKTKARQFCHTYETTKKENDCLTIAGDSHRMMKYLYDTRPSGCERTGYCQRCIPCGYDCMTCEDPDFYDNFMNSMANKWDDFKSWLNK